MVDTEKKVYATYDEPASKWIELMGCEGKRFVGGKQLEVTKEEALAIKRAKWLRFSFEEK